MSSLFNGSGSDVGTDTSSSGGMLDSIKGMFGGTGSSDVSGLGSALQSGDATVGANSTGFTMPDGSTLSAAASPDLAGLTGVGSGMTMPDMTGAVTPEGNYGFTAPTGSTDWASKLGDAMGAGAKIANADDTSNALANQLKAGGAKMTTKAQNFGAPIAAMPTLGQLSPRGQGLLQLLTKYRAGTS